jgi:hypothetical protein
MKGRPDGSPRTVGMTKVLSLCIGGRWSELQIPIRLRSGQALGFSSDEKGPGGAYIRV